MRISVVETLKFIVAAAIGYTARIMLEASRESTLARNIQPANTDKIASALASLHEQMRAPYQPKSIDDVIEYRFLSENRIYDGKHCFSSVTDKGGGESFVRHRKADILHAIHETINLLQQSKGKQYSMKNFLSGFERIDPLRGKEYIMDIEVESSDAQQKKESELFRLEMVKPFGSIQMVSSLGVDLHSGRPMLHLIMSGHAEKQMQLILKQLKTLEKEVFRKGLHVQIYLVLYFAGNITSSNVAPLWDAIKSIQQRYVSLSNFATIQPFNVTSASLPGSIYAPHRMKEWMLQKLQHSSSDYSLQPYSHIILSDVSNHLENGFYKRCRATLLTANSKKSSYSPVAYFPITLTVPTTSNEWDRDNFQVVCTTYGMYQQVGPYDSLLPEKWSDEEERNLFLRIIEKGFQVLRSADPSVSSSYDQPCELLKQLKVSNNRRKCNQ